MGDDVRAGHLFRYVTNQPPKANSVFHSSGIGKQVPASAGMAKTGMVHSVADERGMWSTLPCLTFTCDFFNKYYIFYSDFLRVNRRNIAHTRGSLDVAE